MDSNVLSTSIRDTLKIPHHVPIGLPWRRIRNEHKRKYAWIDVISPPQAIHFNIDADYAARYYDDVAKLCRKGGKNKVLGLQLRIVSRIYTRPYRIFIFNNFMEYGIPQSVGFI